ncbi:MAG: DinB family protein [Bacteroidota bacterium]
MYFQDQVHNALIEECRRRLFDENYKRIEKCLSLISEEEVWQRPNDNSNSIGNLILHLCGNVRQWLVSGLGEQADVRKRQEEFDARKSYDKVGLIEQLESLKRDVNTTLDNLSSETWLKKRDVQCYHESGLSILIHVMEHFSYHTGQITFYVKAMKDLQTNYYDDKNLSKTN